MTEEAKKEAAALAAKKSECVRVVIRCRPMSSQEKTDGRECIIEMKTKAGVVSVRKPKSKEAREAEKDFTYDSVYDWKSHSIFTITIETCEMGVDGEAHIRVGKLNMTDLAGSERQSKTGATGELLKEATKINLSLSALGNVISALVDGRSSHIPYRDSKLTRLLQDSLGGNTRTVMVANIGPADYNYDETLSTLRYAYRAKSIRNKPRINEDPKDAMIREFQEEIVRLRNELANKGGKGGGSGGRPKSKKVEEKEIVVEKIVEKIVKEGISEEEMKQ
eukprot:Cvel_26767.t1-p1 / transcript=Cvel_26767.t1 / gene=Cvel_26767 / organism=Chromera_velia_CCMP2878 / gene_product=Kinesin-II 95 kDa subunit, putative / transcript_product=Kinesin-II 95 kDa subunit, putative / location=Cvel_scaffold3236:439-6982(-) / protein_length=277 / sequence_SO=supercontig / SO=protein_coding / is_pseudo=false